MLISQTDTLVLLLTLSINLTFPNRNILDQPCNTKIMSQYTLTSQQTIKDMLRSRFTKRQMKLTEESFLNLLMSYTLPFYSLQNNFQFMIINLHSQIIQKVTLNLTLLHYLVKLQSPLQISQDLFENSKQRRFESNYYL